MVETKRPPLAKWNPYKIGENKSVILKEVSRIVSNKDHRRKVGLEVGALREFKGNAHWNAFLSIELAELISKRVNDDMKNIFIQNVQGLNSTSSYLNNIAQQLKKSEFNLSNVTTLSSNNMIKVVKSETANLSKMASDLGKIQKNMDTKIKTVHSKIIEISNDLKETISEHLQNILKDLSERNEASQGVITEDIKGLKDQSAKKFEEIIKQSNELGKTSSESINKVTGDVSVVSKNVVELKDRISTFQEANNNILDDMQNAVITEFQEGVGGLMKQNLENLKSTKSASNEQKKEIVSQLNETNENFTSLIEATNEHMDKINEDISGNLTSTENLVRKELNKEVADLRSILSTIRSDIELMKSVLTKVDSKIH